MKYIAATAYQGILLNASNEIKLQAFSMQIGHHALIPDIPLLDMSCCLASQLLHGNLRNSILFLNLLLKPSIEL